MSTLLRIDQRFRYLFSVFYRIILITYSFIIFLNYKTAFLPYQYFVFVALYLLLYFICFKKDGIYAILRLVIDYLLIFGTICKIYDKDFFVFSFIMLPFLNANNHSGSKRSVFLYIIPFIFFYFIDSKFFSYKIIIVFISFFLIHLFGRIRNAYFNFTENLNSCIDDFFLDENSLKRPHRIYKKAIEILNLTRLIFFKIEKILCFRVYEDRIDLINGSEFIWNYNIEDQKRIIFLVNKIRNFRTIKDIIFEIDGITCDSNICFKCKIENSIYLYAIVPEYTSESRTILTPFFNEIVTPFFVRLSKVFETFICQKKIELDKMIEMESKIAYVNNAINSMHFMRNKLGPIRNYLDMIKDFNSNNVDDKDKKQELKKIIENERNKLNVSLDNILERANIILEKANNPFNVNELKEHSTLKLYVELKKIWELFFVDNRPIVRLEIDQNKLELKNLLFNTLGLELVFCNWINNMEKYNAGICFVEIYEDDLFVVITFVNSVYNLSETEMMVRLFNSDDRIEISRRNSHGLIEIKDFLNQMNIPANMSLEEDILNLHLKFLKHR